MNWNTLVRQAKVKKRIKRLDDKINEVLAEMEQQGKIKPMKEGDFRDSTFTDVELKEKCAH
jgi:hypothetical protein